MALITPDNIQSVLDHVQRQSDHYCRSATKDAVIEAAKSGKRVERMLARPVKSGTVHWVYAVFTPVPGTGTVVMNVYSAPTQPKVVKP
jgi:hypothetical protein